MHIDQLYKLKENGFITEEQLQKIEPVITGKIVSLFYELRITLYLGIMLFTSGAGLLIYENIGELGHVISIGVLFILTAICFFVAFTRASPYTHGKAESPFPYYDYLVLLGCLLFISLIGYLQFRYELFNNGMGAATLVTALFFFYSAYRFDHIGVLSLGITALASFFSISVSPSKWYSGDFLDAGNLYNTGIIFGTCIGALGLLLDKAKIKTHFTFTYLNFASLVFLTGCLTGMFDNSYYSYLYMLGVFAGSAGIAYYANRTKSFLFLLYAFVFSYIAFTYLLSAVMDDPFLWFFYFLASCGGFIYFIIRYKSFFKRVS